MTFARREIVAPGEVAIYHCVTRCVRRAFLCGEDLLTGRNFDYRKEWVRERLEMLAGIFAIDVCGYSVMSNHLHVILRTRPDVVHGWSDAEVAYRWLRLCPHRRNADGTAAEPAEREIEALVADKVLCADRRQRLGNLSWFMACLSQNIARRANREDHCTGRFWEGRFKCQLLLDDAAVLACSIYVDLNPIRAGIVVTPEESKFTSVYDRIRSQTTTSTSAAVVSCGVATPSQASAPDGWLCSVTLAETAPAPASLETAADSLIPEPGDPPRGATGSAVDKTSTESVFVVARRASDKGYLRLKWVEYLSLLDWTGRQVREDKRGSIPGELAPILARLQIRADKWLDTISQFGRRFRRAVGNAACLAARAEQQGRQWYQGLRNCESAFG